MSTQGQFNFETIAPGIEQQLELALAVFSQQLSGRIQAYSSGMIKDLGAMDYSDPGSGTKELALGSPVWDEYGAYVEFGSKPHLPPLEPLIQWVRKKGIKSVQRSSSGAKGTNISSKKGIENNCSSELLAAARAIRFSIAKKGTRAHKFVERALRDFGVEYNIVQDSRGMFYSIDITGYLNRTGFWEQINSV